MELIKLHFLKNNDKNIVIFLLNDFIQLSNQEHKFHLFEIFCILRTKLNISKNDNNNPSKIIDNNKVIINYKLNSLNEGKKTTNLE